MQSAVTESSAYGGLNVSNLKYCKYSLRGATWRYACRFELTSRMDTLSRQLSIRFVLIHYHIFKNAGTTVECILRREFPEAFAILDSSDPAAVLRAEQLKDYLLKNPGVKAVSSHHLRYPIGLVPGTVLFDCCFLRHPLDRLQSMYQHFRRTDEDNWLAELARRESPQEFMKTLVENAPHLVSNVQTLYLSTGGAFTRPAGSWDLENACEIVQRMSFPGLVERFDESLVVAEYYLRPAFPELRLDYVAQNVSPARDSPQNGVARNTLIRLWGSELHSQLTHLNEYDLKLFKRAGAEIRRRTALISGFSRRLEEFQRRCDARRSIEPLNFKSCHPSMAANT